MIWAVTSALRDVAALFRDHFYYGAQAGLGLELEI